jgi:multisubunit Na+/H+ antiporter MnhE subunit
MLTMRSRIPGPVRRANPARLVAARPGNSGEVRWLPEVGLWWLALVAVWVLTLSAPSAGELVVAALVAVPCAVAARAARRTYRRAWPARRGWLRWAIHLPGAVLRDSARLLRGVPDGALRRVPLADDSPSTRAAATVLVSASPGTLVLDDDVEGDVEGDDTGGALLVHALTDDVSGVERAVRR